MSMDGGSRGGESIMETVAKDVFIVDTQWFVYYNQSKWLTHNRE
jgi:hypothetical protein